MKKVILMFLVISMATPFSLFATFGAKNCECGTHENGIYTFSVSDGSGVTCCNGTIYPESLGAKKIYQYSGGAWEWVRDESMSGSAAQSACCNNS